MWKATFSPLESISFVQEAGFQAMRKKSCGTDEVARAVQPGDAGEVDAVEVEDGRFPIGQKIG